MLTGCGTIKVTAAPTTTTSPIVITLTSTPRPPIKTPERVRYIRPGVFVADEINLLPLPLGGYKLYLVGEMHGAREIHNFTLKYLKMLHYASGLQDIALELSQFYEKSVDQYVLGLRETLPDPEYWQIAGMDVFDGIRLLNNELPEDEKIRVHLVDLDIQTPMIYAHLHVLYDQLHASSSFSMPSLCDFETWTEIEMITFVNRFASFAEADPCIKRELSNLRYSIRNDFLMMNAEGWEKVANEHLTIREAAISENVQSILSELGGMSLLGLFGSWHTQKRLGIQAIRGPSQLVKVTAIPWAQRLVERGVSTYSIYVGGISGHVLFKNQIRSVRLNLNQFVYPDGKTLFGILPLKQELLFIDLTLRANYCARFGKNFDPLGTVFDPALPAGLVYDGILLFKEISPI